MGAYHPLACLVFWKWAPVGSRALWRASKPGYRSSMWRVLLASSCVRRIMALAGGTRAFARSTMIVTHHCGLTRRASDGAAISRRARRVTPATRLTCIAWSTASVYATRFTHWLRYYRWTLMLMYRTLCDRSA